MPLYPSIHLHLFRLNFKRIQTIPLKGDLLAKICQDLLTSMKKIKFQEKGQNSIPTINEI